MPVPLRTAITKRAAPFRTLAPVAAMLAVLISSCTRIDQPRTLVLKSRPVGFSRSDPEATTAGKLRFRGSLELTSKDPDFGGLSGLLVSADGASFVAISDEAHWIGGTLSYTGDMLTGAAGTMIAPMLDLSGNAMAHKQGDAEGLATADDGKLDDLFISFEGDHRVWRYAFGRDGPRATPVDIPLPATALEAPKNGGIEGITRVADGVLFALSEHFKNPAGTLRAWTIPYRPAHCPDAAGANGTESASTDVCGGARSPAERSIVPIAPYSMTDVRRLPDGNILTLERRYNAVDGVGIELRRIPWTDDDRGPLDGEILTRLDAGYEIDNMEGLSVRTDAAGRTLVYMVSDDNFNRPLQRTLLMMFELLP